MDVKYPWPSTVNFSNFVTVKPNLKNLQENGETDFSIWKRQMVCLLESQEVVGFINGEILKPDAESEEKLWRRTDVLVTGWILGSIGKDALDRVWELETARDVWLELDNIFNLQSANDDQEEEGGEKEEKTGEDLSRYLQLYKEALRGDWETAKAKFFDQDEGATKAIITSDSGTALPVAVSTGKANYFVSKLVELLPLDALAHRDNTGSTALHEAAIVGNTEAAIALVNKNPDLLYIFDDDEILPVIYAAIYCKKATLDYLISVSKPNVPNNPFEGELGIRLLVNTIDADFFDVALELVKKYPDLATLRYDGLCALSYLARRESAFASTGNFSWWQNFIFHRIPLKNVELKAAQATPEIDSDIESASNDASAYKKCSGSFTIVFEVAQMIEPIIWNVIEHLVPQVKHIREKKEKHEQALELVKFLCKQMISMPEKEAGPFFCDSTIEAAKHGISEIVEVIMDMHPQSIFSKDGTRRTVFHLAASFRFENIFNLLYNMSDRKYKVCQLWDKQRNNLMHVCAKLAPPNRLNLVPGAALQMQRELQWFNEMEKFVPPSEKTLINKEGNTPKIIFSKEHEELKDKGERWMKDTASACTIAAALIATVVFAAAFTVPGGVVPETGIPIFSNEFSFVLFAISDIISLFTSITSLLMFLSILTSRYAEEDFLHVLPKRLCIGLLTLFISITFMMVAFSAALYLLTKEKLAWFITPVAALACLPVTSFVLLQFPLLIDVIYSTYGPGIFGKKSDRMLY